MEFTSRRKLALITGASSGIGYELAILFAKNGYDLLIVAENDSINEAKKALEKLGTMVVGVQADLRNAIGIKSVIEAVEARKQDLYAIALNAGVGASGDFLTGTNLETDINMIDLNVVSTVHLAKMLLPNLVTAGEGRVLFTSSIASLSPGPFNAVYHASKAFIQSFAEALREELKDSGVTVTSLMPGATDTHFFARAHMLDTKVGQSKKADPAKVAKAGFDALMQGDAAVIAGSFMDKFENVMHKILPEALQAKRTRTENEPLSPGDDDSVDALEMLKQQHRDAEELFDRIEDADPAERPAIFNILANKLLEHMMIEEDVFYPAVAEFAPEEATHARDEHAEAKGLIQQILLNDKISTDYLMMVQELKDKILEHVEEEENSLFPKCEISMDRDELIYLADEMRDLMVEIEAQGSLWISHTKRPAKRTGLRA